MKKLLAIIFLLVVASVAAYGQQAACPAGFVCISPEAARRSLQLSDELEAEKKLTAAQAQAIADLKAEIARVQIELAKVSGEKSQLEQDRVRWTAVIDVLIKQARPKKVGLINLF